MNNEDSSKGTRNNIDRKNKKGKRERQKSSNVMVQDSSG